MWYIEKKKCFLKLGKVFKMTKRDAKIIKIGMNWRKMIKIDLNHLGLI